MTFLSLTKKLIKKRILSQVRTKHLSMFHFGINAFTLTTYNSLAGNARQIIKNANTAASKVYRLTGNKNIISSFHKLVFSSGLVNKDDWVNVDFSTFCGFQTLAFGVQTKLGRAIPVWLDCLTYPIKQVGSQNLFILEQFKLLGQQLGFWPRFVFDRGFVIPTLIEFMIENNIKFCIRVKKGQTFQWKDHKGNKRRYAAVKIGKYTKDTTITAYGTTLRLIISPPPPVKKRGVLPIRNAGILSPTTLTRAEINF